MGATFASLAPNRPAVGCHQLFLRYRISGDREAHGELVARHRSAARKIARRYARRRIPRDRLHELADAGLRRAIENFDPGRDAEFMPLAAGTILVEVKRELREPATTREESGPAGAHSASRLLAARERMPSAPGRAPAVAELAEYLEWSLEEVVETLDHLPAAEAGRLPLTH